MNTHRSILVTSLLLASPAHADLLRADFSGLAHGIETVCRGSVPNIVCPGQVSFAGVPFMATMLFDTDKGQLTSPSPGTHRLDGGILTGSFTLAGHLAVDNLGATYPVQSQFMDNGSTLTPWSSWGGSTDYLIWSDDPADRIFAATGLYWSASFYLMSFGGPGEIPDAFRFGRCPTQSPCGHTDVESWSLTDPPAAAPAHAPGPVAGSGLLGLLLTGLFAFFRRK